MFVRCSSIAPHTASMNPSSSRSNSAGSAMASRWYAAVRRPGRTSSASRRRGRRRGAAGRAAPPAPPPLGRRTGDPGTGHRRGRCRALPAAMEAVGTVLELASSDHPDPLLGHQHEPRAEPGVRAAVAQRPVPPVAAHGSSRALASSHGGHPRAPPAATSGRAARGPAVPSWPAHAGTKEHHVGRIEVGHHPATQLTRLECSVELGAWRLV